MRITAFCSNGAFDGETHLPISVWSFDPPNLVVEPGEIDQAHELVGELHIHRSGKQPQPESALDAARRRDESQPECDRVELIEQADVGPRRKNDVAVPIARDLLRRGHTGADVGEDRMMIRDRHLLERIIVSNHDERRHLYPSRELTHVHHAEAVVFIDRLDHVVNPPVWIVCIAQ